MTQETVLTSHQIESPLMKFQSCSILGLLVVLIVGCGSEQPRTVADGADLEAIREYEASIEAMHSQQSEEDMFSEE